MPGAGTANASLRLSVPLATSSEWHCIQFTLVIPSKAGNLLCLQPKKADPSLRSG
jgi:hypothetical protein